MNGWSRLLVFGWGLIFPRAVSAQVVINEVMPNPADQNDASEWIELYNSGNEPINLGGFELKDGSDKAPYLFPEQIIEGNKYYLLNKHESKIQLNNDKDSVLLFDGNSVLIDSIEYINASENFSYSRIPDGVGPFYWVTILTPNEKNESETKLIETKNIEVGKLKIVSAVACPNEGEAESVTFKIEKPGQFDDYRLVDTANNSRTLSGIKISDEIGILNFSHPWLNNSGDEITLISPSGERLEIYKINACNAVNKAETPEPTSLVQTAVESTAKPQKITESQQPITVKPTQTNDKDLSPDPSATKAAILGKIHEASQTGQITMENLTVTSKQQAKFYILGGVMLFLAGVLPGIKGLFGWA